MLLKVLDENRVKILMEDQDIAYYDLPFEKLNYEDPLSRAFIYELIQKTYDQTGVNFRDCRIMIEVIPGVSRSYYIILTRIQQDGAEKIEFDKAERPEGEMYIFRFDRGLDVLKFFDHLRKDPPDKSELYEYGGQYYALLSFAPHQASRAGFERTLHTLEEYGGRCRYHYINEALLKEWGRQLLGADACGVLSCRDEQDMLK